MPKANLSFLDNIGSSDKGDALQLDATQKSLIELAATFAIDARQLLNKVDRNSSGFLSDSIVPLDPVLEGNGIRVDVEVADYYKFVNSGVRGWRDKKGSGSTYQFKRPGKGGYSGTSKMVESIKKWLVKEGRKITDKSKNKVAIVARESRRQKITDTTTKEAVKIAGIVRRDGLKRTNFWDTAVANLEKNVDEKIGNAVKVDIINSF